MEVKNQDQYKSATADPVQMSCCTTWYYSTAVHDTRVRAGIGGVCWCSGLEGLSRAPGEHPD
eukprot:3936216-Rhodomonas_salina.1